MFSHNYPPDHSTDYRVEIIDTETSLEDFVSRWVQFTNTSNNIHFYQDLERIQISQSTNQNTQGFRIIVLLKNNDIHCIAPLIREPQKFPVKFGSITLATIKCRRYKLPAGKLLFSEHADRLQCIRRILSLPRSTMEGINCLFIEEMLMSDAELLSRNLRGYRLKHMNHPPQSIWRLEIKGTFEHYLMRLNSKKRSEMRRRTRKLDSATDSWNIKCIDKASDVAELLFAQAYVYDRCWKSSGLDQLRTGLGQRYLEEVASRGWLRSYILYCDNIPCAYSINFQYRDIFYGQEMAYDEDKSQLGVGNVLVQETIKDLHQNNSPKFMDFGFGDNPQKKLFCTQSILASDTYLVRQFSLSCVLIEIQFLLSRLYHQFHQLAVLMNLDRKLKKKLSNLPLRKEPKD